MKQARGTTDRLAWLAEPRWAVVILVGFCVVHFAIRCLLSPNFTLDESEQMLFSQSLEWGYRFRHPPLITWLVWATLTATGDSRIAFFLLKYAIMAAGLIAYYQAGRLVIRDDRLALLATIGLLSTFSMGYLPLIDLMHTVLLATMLAALLWIVARVMTAGRWSDYLLLGVILALGTLSKYVFAILPPALAIGIAATPWLRARVKPARLLAALALMLLLLAPFGWWAIHQEQTFVGLTTRMTHGDGAGVDPLGWLRGTFGLLVALVGFVLPGALSLPLVYRNACLPLEGGDEANRAWRRAYLIAMAAAALVMLASVFIVGATEFKTRWMHQVAMPFFLWFFLRVAIVGAAPRAHQAFVSLALAFAVLVALTRIGIYALHGRDCSNCRDYWPMQTYARGIREAGFDHGSIVAPDFDLAGNLRYVLPQARLLTPGYPPSVFGPDRSGQCLAAWDGDGEPPTELMNYLRNTLEADPEGAVRGRITGILHTTDNRYGTLSYILMPGKGRCR